MSIQQMAMIRADDVADMSETDTARGGFGELLRGYRQSAALTQEELAHLSAAAAAVGITAARRLLDQLASAHLLEESGHGHYVFHDLLRLYAVEQASTEHADDDRACAVSGEGWH